MSASSRERAIDVLRRVLRTWSFDSDYAPSWQEAVDALNSVEAALASIDEARRQGEEAMKEKALIRVENLLALTGSGIPTAYEALKELRALAPEPPK